MASVTTKMKTPLTKMWKAGIASAGGGEWEFIVEHVNFEVPIKHPRIFVESVSGVGG